MSDPAKDHMARKRKEKREKIREEYTPIVIWIRVPDGKSVNRIRKWIQEKLSDLPFVSVATTNVPYTYATDGVLRKKDVDKN